MIGITGQPNTGKSWTGDKICINVSGSRYDVEDWLCYSIETVLQKTFHYAKFKGKPMTMELIYSIEDVDAWITKNREHIKFRPGRCIMLDEAGSAAFVRQFFSKDNIILSKMIQLWRFLRMIVVIVVPGNMRVAESMISLFLDVEIMMIGKDNEYARCVVYDYIGWKKNKEPIRRRIKGCRYQGHIKITPMKREDADKYEKAMWHSKFGNLMKLAKTYKRESMTKIGQTKTIWDDVDEVHNNPERFKNPAKQGGRYSANLIETYLEIPARKAQKVKVLAEQKYIKEHEGKNYT